MSTKAELAQRLREAKQELKAFQERVMEHGQIRLFKAEVTETGLGMTISSPAFRDLAAMMHEQFQMNKGTNYVWMEMTHKPDEGPWVSYSLTLQKKDGETPAEQNTRLKAELAEYKDKEAKVTAALASLEEEPLKEGDEIIMEEDIWEVCSVAMLGGVVKAYRLARMIDDHRMAVPSVVMPFLIRGGATIERKEGGE